MVLGLFNKSKKQHLAVDIGSQNTKIMTLNPKGHVDQLTIKPTPPNIFDTGAILDEGNLVDFLLNCAGTMDLKDEISVITGVSGKGVITKKIDIPQMEEHLIPEHLPFESEQYLPYEVDEMDLDYEILKGIPTSSENQIPILLVAVLKNTVNQYSEVFEKSYMSCDILDASVFALFNVFEKNYSLDPNKNYLLIDIGLNSSNFVGVVKNQVIFTRSFPFGGNFHTQKIMNKMQVTFDAAEEFKKTLGHNKESPQELLPFIQEEVNPAFCGEIRSGYEVYLSFFPNHPVSEIYVTGGGSRTKGLLKALNDQMSVPVSLLNPFLNVKLNPNLMTMEEEITPFSSVVTGLALRTVHG